MKKYFKYLLLVAVVAVFSFSLAVPNAGAVTIAELIAQIKALQAQLAQLQAQQGTTTAWCHDFNTNLRVGDNGSEIDDLNGALVKEGLLETGTFEHSSNFQANFSEETAAAVTGFQQKYADEILKSYGLKYGTGFVGKSTRAKLNKLYGCSNQPSNPPAQVPVISGVSGPQTLNINQMGTWSVKASVDPGGSVSIVSYSVIWGDEAQKMYSPTSGGVAAGTQTATFTHTYSQAGNYSPMFTVTTSDGKSSQTSLSVNVGNAIAPTPIPFISVFSPNGGETWQIGKTYDIKWSASGVPVVDIILTNNATPGYGVIYIAHGVTVPNGIYSWTVPTTVTPGSYGIRIEGGTYMEGKGARQYLDENNAPFTIVSAPATPTLSCTDTDGGDNPNVKGTAVSTNSNGGVGTSPDVCHKDKGAPDDGYLTEFSCAANGGITPREVYCAYGCNAGACLPTPASASILENVKTQLDLIQKAINDWRR